MGFVCMYVNPYVYKGWEASFVCIYVCVYMYEERGGGFVLGKLPLVLNLCARRVSRAYVVEQHTAGRVDV